MKGKERKGKERRWRVFI